MFKIFLNVLLLNVLAVPCLLVFNDIDPITGEWNWGLNLIGVIYLLFFIKNIVKPIFKSIMN